MLVSAAWLLTPVVIKPRAASREALALALRRQGAGFTGERLTVMGWVGWLLLVQTVGTLTHRPRLL